MGASHEEVLAGDASGSVAVESAGGPEVDAEAATPPAPHRVLRRLRRRPGALIAAAFLVVVGLLAVFAPLLGFEPDEQNVVQSYEGPSSAHWLGTDPLGRDLLSRVVFGARTSLGVAVAVVTLAVVIAVPIGLISGFKGGWVDHALMRVVDALLSIPGVVLALAIAGALGPGSRNSVIALTVIYIPSFVRLTRAEAIARRQETFIEASLVAGVPTRRILFRRLLPNVRSALLVASAFWLGSALLAESALAYLGLGAQPPTASWGNMLRLGYDTSIFTDSWQLIVPGAAIALAVLAFNTLGEGIRDAFGTTDLTIVSRHQQRGLTIAPVPPPSSSSVAVASAVGSTPPSSATNAPDVLLSVEGLCAEFATDQGQHRVVDDVSFSIRRGEVLGLVGESGSGKTVTALSIMRLVPSPPGRIVSGSVWFEGRDLLTLNLKAMHRVRGAEIAMVFQDPMTSLDPSYTIGAQLVEAYRLHRDVSHDAAVERAVELLDLVRIPAGRQRLGDFPHQLSGGMRQRVVIAMALACEPQLLIADEPTTALDVTIQAQVLDLLLDLQRESGMAVLFVTHDLGVVADVCDRVAVLYAGQVIEMNSVHDLFARPRHPYTEGLLSAMPQVGRERSQRLKVIPGRVPLPYELPSGCRFHPRCDYVLDSCKTSAPMLREEAAAGQTRCARSQDIVLQGVPAGAYDR